MLNLVLRTPKVRLIDTLAACSLTLSLHVAPVLLRHLDQHALDYAFLLKLRDYNALDGARRVMTVSFAAGLKSLIPAAPPLVEMERRARQHQLEHFSPLQLNELERASTLIQFEALLATATGSLLL